LVAASPLAAPNQPHEQPRRGPPRTRIYEEGRDVYAWPGAQTLGAANDDAGVRRMLEFLAPLAPALIVIEATGRYHHRLAAELLVAVVQARDFASALGKLGRN
jgi:transposase